MPTSGAANSPSSGRLGGVPTEIRTLVTAVKGRCPGPLDDGDESRAGPDTTAAAERPDHLLASAGAAELLGVGMGGAAARRGGARGARPADRRSPGPRTAP